MTAEATTEYQLARKMAEEYRSRGYDVSAEVPLDFLPGYRADLVVEKDGEVKVIEVKTRSSLASQSRLNDLARAIDEKPGWSFELLLVAQPERLDSPEGARSLESGSILERLREAEAILRAGHSEPAFVLAWSACEAALRLLIAALEAPGDGIMTTAHTLRQAIHLGVISEETFEDLDSLQQYRNAIVHAYSHKEFDEAQVRERVKELIEIARGMIVAPV